MHPLCVLPLLVALAHALCFTPIPPFPPATLSSDIKSLTKALSRLEEAIKNYEDAPADIDKSNSSFSIEITSPSRTIWSYHHTAKLRAAQGTKKVNENSVYRIASISKVFTTLVVLQQHEKGVLSLDDPITKWLPELLGREDEEGYEDTPRWDEITLRSLASQLGGLVGNSPRSVPIWDTASEIPNSFEFGFPPLDLTELPSCDPDRTSESPKPCSRQEILDDIRSQQSLFPPNYIATYSNNAFTLLGLVVEAATGQPFIQALSTGIFEPANMQHSSFDPPSASKGVIPISSNHWAIDVGHQNSSYGLYSTSGDLSRFLRFILSDDKLKHAWLQPHSFGIGTTISSYGMPWEIYRTSSLTPSRAPIAFFTKAGRLNSYFLEIQLVPDHDIGITFLTAGNPTVLPWIRRLVAMHLLPALEHLAGEQARRALAGTYRHVTGSNPLDSSMTLAVDDTKGLHITSWISNGTNFLDVMHDFFVQYSDEPPDIADSYYVQLFPSRKNPVKREGEVTPLFKDKWLIKHVPVRYPSAHAEDLKPWEDFCFIDVDSPLYFGKPFQVVDFLRKSEKEGGEAEAMDLSSFRIQLKRVNREEGMWSMPVAVEMPQRQVPLATGSGMWSQMRYTAVEWIEWINFGSEREIRGGCDGEL